MSNTNRTSVPSLCFILLLAVDAGDDLDGTSVKITLDGGHFLLADATSITQPF